MSDCLWFDHRVSKVGVRVGEMGKKKVPCIFPPFLSKIFVTPFCRFSGPARSGMGITVIGVVTHCLPTHWS